MNLIIQAIQWIFDPRHYVTTALGTGIPDALGQHLALFGISLGLTTIIAVPLGLYIGHTGKGRTVAIVASNITRAFPSLGVIAIFLLLFPKVLFLPYGYGPDIVAFVLLGIPPLLAGSYAGLESVDRQTIDAARAVGMTEWQILRRVEVPLGIRLILGGFRSSALQIIATVTIASLYGQLSLGTFVTSGLASGDFVEMTAGAILVAVLALLTDGILAIVQRLVVPRGISGGPAKTRNTARDELAVATSKTYIKEGISS